MKVAVIFASGAGKRLNPLTHTIHKSLIKVGDLPLIEHIIENLQTLKSLQEIIIVTGYRHQDFLYLKDKYSNLQIIENKDYQNYESAYVLSLLPKRIFEHDLFFISGDFVMKENCFSDSIQANVMAALKRVDSKDDWSYQLDAEGNIIGLIKTNDSNSLLASEWSHISQDWGQLVAADLSNQAELNVLKQTILGQYLIKRSLQDQMPLKPYLIDYDKFWDLDDQNDLNRVEKYFHS